MRHLRTPLAPLVLAVTCHAQTLNWKLETPSSKPTGRYAHALTYDAARGRVVLFGGVRLAAPLNVDLNGAGMPSCWLLQSLDILWGFPVRNGAGTFPLSIPNDQRLVGVRLLLQSIIRDPPANAAGWLTTNGGEAEIRK